MTAQLTALQTDLLTRIATRRDAGQHTWGTDILDIPTRTVTSATKRGLIEATDQGWALTDAGRAAIGRASAPAEAPMAASVISGKAKARIRSTSPRPCGCGCGELTGGGDYRPGHDARHAGIVGRQVAADADGSTTSQQVRELVAAKLAGRPKLIDKAVGVATRELERSRMAAAKRSA